MPALIILLIGMVVAPDLYIELFTQSVDARYTHPVQTARDLISRGVELAACVQLGQHYLDRWHLLAIVQRLLIYRNTTAIIDNRNGVIDVNDDIDPLRVTSQRF